MKIKKFILPVSILLFAMCAIGLQNGCNAPSENSTEAPSPAPYDAHALAKNDPDAYVWHKFCEFFAYTDGSKHMVQWENWINEDSVYDPPCDQARIWPSEPPKTRFNQPKHLTIMQGLRSVHGVFDTTLFADLTLNNNPYFEEARINKPMFDYIVGNKLYLKHKVEAMAKAGTIDLPRASAILKSQWKTIQPTEKEKYYWHELKVNNDSMVLIGLAAFHLVTHELEDFVWSTFEHVDNPGRCDYIGCHDSFGFTKADVEPHKIDSLRYLAPAEMTQELKDLFAQKKIDDVFKNYRLKVAQTQYMVNDSTPTLNGSSVLEANLVSTSSCISCHARATVNAQTGKPLSMFVEPNIVGDGTFEMGFLPNTSKGWHPECYVGRPILADYSPTSSDGKDSTFHRTNFLWQLAQDAGSCDSTDNGAGNQSAQ